MSEPVQGGTEGVNASAAAASAGALLRAAREAQGLHIGALAVALKVPVKKIEALEADRLQELPDMVFVRSLAMSVCRALKISPEPVLALLPEAVESKLKPMDGGLNTQFRDTSMASRGAWRTQLLSPIGLGAMALLLATIAVWLWRTPSLSADLDAVSVSTVATPAATTHVDAASVAQPVVSPVATAEPQTAAGSLSPAVNDAKAPAGIASNASGQVLELRARGVSWVEVNDADGVARIRKLTSAGEMLQVSGKLPLSVVLGRADQLDVLVHGQSLDFIRIARDNVARFEVK